MPPPGQAGSKANPLPVVLKPYYFEESAAKPFGPLRRTTVSITATSGVYLTLAPPEAGAAPVPASKSRYILTVDTKLTNNTSRPITIGGTWGTIFDAEEHLEPVTGEFDVPQKGYRAAFGKHDAGDANEYLYFPGSLPFSCRLSDQPIAGDCEIGLRGEVEGNQVMLAPGASVPMTLEGSIVGDRSTRTGVPLSAVPQDFETSGVRVFLRDPADQIGLAGQGGSVAVPCTDPAHPPVFHSLFEFRIPALRSTCELPLTLELRLPGETAPPLNYNGLGPGGLDCRISGVDSSGTSAITFASLTAGEDTDIEKSYRNDGDRHWQVDSRSGSSAGLSFQSPGFSVGEVSNDIEASATLKYGSGAEIRLGSGKQGEREADQLVQYFNGDLDPAHQEQVRKLALKSLASSYYDTGVDLEGSVGGSVGHIKGEMSHVQGEKIYRDGSRGIDSTVTLDGNISGSSVLALDLGGNAVTSTELVFNNQYTPTLLTTKADVGVERSLEIGGEAQIDGAPAEVFQNIHDASISGNVSAHGGAVLSAEDQVDLQTAGTARLPTRKLAQHLVDALDRSPDQLPPDIDELAQELSKQARSSIVVSLLGKTHKGLKVSFSDGLSYGLDFGSTTTTAQAILASERYPDGDFRRWSACVPDKPPAGA